MRIGDWSSDVCSSDLRNRIQLVTAEGVDDWPQMTKAEVAERLCRQSAATLGRHSDQQEQGTRSISDRKSVVEGKSVSGRVDLGGRRTSKKKNTPRLHKATDKTLTDLNNIHIKD